MEEADRVFRVSVSVIPSSKVAKLAAEKAPNVARLRHALAALFILLQACIKLS